MSLVSVVLPGYLTALMKVRLFVVDWMLSAKEKTV